jgi:hypothetical protein
MTNKRDALAEAHFKKVNPLLVDQLEYFKEHGHSKTIEAFKAGYDARDEEIGKLLSTLKSIAQTDTSEKAPDLMWLCEWRNKTKQLAALVLREHESGGAG